VRYDVQLDPVAGIIHVTLFGLLTPENCQPMALEARKTAANLGLPLLYDATQAELDLDLGMIYRYPREVKYEKPEHKAIRAAIHYTNDRPKWEFFVATSSNSGIYFRLFNNREDAIQWLKGPTSPDESPG